MMVVLVAFLTFMVVVIVLTALAFLPVLVFMFVFMHGVSFNFHCKGTPCPLQPGCKIAIA